MNGKRVRDSRVVEARSNMLKVLEHCWNKAESVKDFITVVKAYLKAHKNGHECSRDAFRTELRAYRPSAAWRVKNLKEFVRLIMNI